MLGLAALGWITCHWHLSVSVSSWDWVGLAGFVRQASLLSECILGWKLGLLDAAVAVSRSSGGSQLTDPAVIPGSSYSSSAALGYTCVSVPLPAQLPGWMDGEHGWGSLGLTLAWPSSATRASFNTSPPHLTTPRPFLSPRLPRLVVLSSHVRREPSVLVYEHSRQTIAKSLLVRSVLRQLRGGEVRDGAEMEGPPPQKVPAGWSVRVCVRARMSRCQET